MRRFIVTSMLLVLPAMALGKQPTDRKVFPAEMAVEDIPVPTLHLKLPRLVFVRETAPTVMRYRLNDSASGPWRIVLDPQTPVR